MNARRTTLSLALAVVGSGAFLAFGVAGVAGAAGAAAEGPSTAPPSPVATTTTAPARVPTPTPSPTVPAEVPPSSSGSTPPIVVNAGGVPARVRSSHSSDSDVLTEVGAGVAATAGLVGLGLAVGARRRRAGAVAR